MILVRYTDLIHRILTRPLGQRQDYFGKPLTSEGGCWSAYMVSAFGASTVIVVEALRIEEMRRIRFIILRLVNNCSSKKFK